MKKRKPNSSKDARINLRITHEDKADLLLHLNGRNMANFIIDAVKRKMQWEKAKQATEDKKQEYIQEAIAREKKGE